MGDEDVSPEVLPEKIERSVRLNPEPSFVLPNPQLVLRQTMTKERLRDLCTNFDKKGFAERCYREAAVMPMLVCGVASGVFDAQKMSAHIDHPRHTHHKPADTVGELMITIPALADDLKLRRGATVATTELPAQKAAGKRWNRDEDVWEFSAGAGVSRQPPREEPLAPKMVAASPCPPSSAGQQACSTPGSVMAGCLGVPGIPDTWSSRDPRVMDPEELQTELEIAMALGRLQPSSGSVEPRSSLTRRRVGGRSKCTPLEQQPRARAMQYEARSALLPTEGFSGILDTASEKRSGVKVPSSIGVRLNQLGLNPMKRPAGSAQQKRKSDRRRFHMPKMDFSCSGQAW